VCSTFDQRSYIVEVLCVVKLIGLDEGRGRSEVLGDLPFEWGVPQLTDDNGNVHMYLAIDDHTCTKIVQKLGMVGVHLLSTGGDSCFNLLFRRLFRARGIYYVDFVAIYCFRRSAKGTRNLLVGVDYEHGTYVTSDLVGIRVHGHTGLPGWVTFEQYSER